MPSISDYPAIYNTSCPWQGIIFLLSTPRSKSILSSLMSNSYLSVWLRFMEKGGAELQIVFCTLVCHRKLLAYSPPPKIEPSCWGAAVDLKRTPSDSPTEPWQLEFYCSQTRRDLAQQKSPRLYQLNSTLSQHSLLPGKWQFRPLTQYSRNNRTLKNCYSLISSANLCAPKYLTKLCVLRAPVPESFSTYATLPEDEESLGVKSIPSLRAQVSLGLGNSPTGAHPWHSAQNRTLIHVVRSDLFLTRGPCKQPAQFQFAANWKM